MSFWFSQLVPPEIQARGIEAEHAFQRALKKGKVRVYRGRVMLIGQNRAGKTSLKKSLLGISFDPGEPSTDGIEVDPSRFEVDVDRVMNWQLVKNEKFTSEFADDIARLVVGELQKPEDQEEKPASSTVTENIQRDVTQGATASPQGNQVLKYPLLGRLSESFKSKSYFLFSSRSYPVPIIFVAYSSAHSFCHFILPTKTC